MKTKIAAEAADEEDEPPEVPSPSSDGGTGAEEEEDEDSAITFQQQPANGGACSWPNDIGDQGPGDGIGHEAGGGDRLVDLAQGRGRDLRRVAECP